MSKILLDYYPAEVKCNKETCISYYAKHPSTGELKRKKIRLNFIASKVERKKYALKLCEEINIKLQNGWNPFVEELLLSGDITLESAIGKFKTLKIKELRKDTVRAYFSILDIFLNWLKNNNLQTKSCFAFDKKNAALFLKHLVANDKISNRTYNNYLRFCKTLFNFFLQHDYIKENPFEKFETKRVDVKFRDVIPPEDRMRIKDYFMKNNVPYYYIMQLCYRCLIRPKEILMLKIKYIDYNNKMLKIPSFVAKNHNERVLALPDDIYDFLVKYKDLNGDLYIFSTGYNPGKQLIDTRASGRTWSVMRAALQLPMSYQFYSLKDTGITEMLEQGMPAKYVKELADHHSLEMTEKYTHKSSAKKILEYNKLKF